MVLRVGGSLVDAGSIPIELGSSPVFRGCPAGLRVCVMRHGWNGGRRMRSHDVQG